MQKEQITKRIIRITFFVFFIATPLIAGVLFCLKDGRVINDIYIPLGGWSDEITYFKEIEGILSHGMPRGYFGYNQSQALYGTLNVWGIIPLIPYVLWGAVFGWNYVSPIYANIFFCTVALLFFYFLLRPKKIWMGMIALFWIANPFLNRYVLSGVVEASVLSQLLMVAVCGEYLLSDKWQGTGDSQQTSHPRKDSLVLIFCTAIICFLTLARPYYAVLFLLPLWKAVRDRKKGWILFLPVLTLLVMALFFVNNHFFCSVYFNNILSFDKIMKNGLGGLFIQLFNSLVEMAKLIWYAIRYKGVGVGWYYLLLAVELLAMLGTCIRRKCTHQKCPPMFIATLIGNPLILLSLMIIYNLVVGARHILPLIIVNAVVLIIESHFSWGIVLAAICLFSTVQTQGADGLPYQRKEYSTYMDSLQEAFAQVVPVSDKISYENVVAMPLSDTSATDPEQKVGTYYGLLFAMPSGVGISLDYEDFYDEPTNMKAGYILVHPGGTIRHTLESIGMHCVFENEELALYAK